MSEDKNAVSRRTVLGGLGAIGVAGALAGAGTSAYFSDRERFDGNELVAGELDLKVDWEEHYSDWSDDEVDGVGAWNREPEEDLTGFPSTAPETEQSVFVENAGAFMANTAIEAFPDQTDTTDPEEALQNGRYDAQRGDIDDAICDLDADLDGVLSHPYRTQGTFGEGPNPQTTTPGDPLVHISDVKPGDFGEVTFSFHLCGNPGYVWLTGDLVDANENDHTELEADDPDENTDEDPDVDGGYVELLDEIRAAIWYDTGPDGVYGADPENKDSGEGDNIFGVGETILPLNGSLRSVLRSLETGMFPLEPEPISNGENTNGDSSVSMIGPGNGDGFADEVIVTGTDDRFGNGPGGGSARNWQCADYEERLEVGDIVGTEIIDTDDGAGITVGTDYAGCAMITVDDHVSNSGTVTLSSNGELIKIVSVKGGPSGENIYVFDDPVALDEITFTTPGDHEISNIDVCCPVTDDGDDPTNGARQCFDNSTTAYIGFEWWLPRSVGNEIQGDSVSFDLGFYTEQCRHNDGRGSSDDGS